MPTKYAIRTSVLSKRWRHVWCNIPALSFNHSPEHKLKADWISEILNRYTALKMRRFHFCAYEYSIQYVEMWIEYAMSRNVENLSLTVLSLKNGVKFEFPDFFYNNSSLKQLTVSLDKAYMIPTCSVSWKCLKKLSLRRCKLPDESIAKILSGCPILQILTLHSCDDLRFLDLSKNSRLKTLRVNYNAESPGQPEIVAPHIRCLKLTNSHSPCTLHDVSSLTEAKLDIFYCHNNFNANLLQVTMLETLKKLRNVEKLTLGESFLQILSLAKIRGVLFPMFKIKALTLKTSISQYVIPGIKRMLQNSPDLKKITVHLKTCDNIIPDNAFDTYLRNLFIRDQSMWYYWNKDRADVKSNHVALFMTVMLENAEALEKLVVRFQDSYCKFKEMVPTLWNENSVSIVLSTKPTEVEVNTPQLLSKSQQHWL